jgi:uncharacterized membrane protein YfcA
VNIAIVCLVALLASGLTFFSGFGLGTLLLPAFALFMPLPQAVAATAVVHLLNGLFKLVLLRRHVDRAVLLRFGAPALLAAMVGAWLLSALGALPVLHRYEAFGHVFEIAPIKLAIGALLLGFALFEIVPRLRDLEFDVCWQPLGGALSGFFGGLSGMQGALRSAFLARSGLDKQAFVATGAAIAAVIDIARLTVYGATLVAVFGTLDHGLLAAAVLAAFAGAWTGNRLLKKTTLRGLQRVVAAMLFVFAIGLIAGAL